MLKLLQDNLGKYAENSRENTSFVEGLWSLMQQTHFAWFSHRVNCRERLVDAFQKYQVTLLLTEFGGLFWLLSPLPPPCVKYRNIPPALHFFELDSLPHYFLAPADSRCSKGGPGWHFHLHSCSIRGRGLFLVLVTVGLQSRAGMVAPRRTSRIQSVPSVLLLGHRHGASWTSCSKMVPHVIYFVSSRMEEGDRKGLPPLVKGITWELFRSLLLIIAHWPKSCRMTGWNCKGRIKSYLMSGRPWALAKKKVRTDVGEQLALPVPPSFKAQLKSYHLYKLPLMPSSQKNWSPTCSAS